MTRFNIIFFFIFSLMHFGFSQNTLAKLKYEEAEEAFQKNEFQTTLTKLDEVEAILKSSNPKTQYLRILAQDKMVDQGGNLNFELLEKLRKNCNSYLIKHESNTSVEDQYKEVYKVSERLRSYPATQADYTKFLEEKKLNQKRLLERPRIIFDSICAVLKYKPGITEKEFKEYNPEVAALLMTKKNKGTAGTITTYARSNVNGPTTMTFFDNVCISYIYAVETGSSETVNKTYQYYKDFLQKNFPADKQMKTGMFGNEQIDFSVAGSHKISILKPPALNFVWLIISGGTF